MFYLKDDCQKEDVKVIYISKKSQTLFVFLVSSSSLNNYS